MQTDAQKFQLQRGRSIPNERRLQALLQRIRWSMRAQNESGCSPGQPVKTAGKERAAAVQLGLGARIA